MWMLKRRFPQMAVASDALPRWALLTASGVYARASTDQIETKLLDHLRADVTCEAWIQVRVSKAKLSDPDGRRDGCWWIHTPLWACGVTTDRQVVVFSDGEWRASVFPVERELQLRKWYHVAVCRRAREQQCDLLIDGEPIELVPLQDLYRLALPVSPRSGLRIAWASLPESTCSLLLHQMRIWSVNVAPSDVKKWSTTDVFMEHPNANKLVAHWSFSSGALTPPEFDLSGIGHDLIIDNITTNSWLSTTPHRFHHTTSSDLVRLVALQDVKTEHNKQTSRFVIEIDVAPTARDGVSTFQAVTVVLVLNFLCYPNPSLTLKGKGAALIRSVHGFVQKLPPTFQLVVYVPSGDHDADTSSVLICTALHEEGKNRARRALEKVVIEKTRHVADLAHVIVNCAQDAKRIVPVDNERQHSLMTVIALTETACQKSDHMLLTLVDDLQSMHSTTTVNVISTTTTESVTASGDQGTVSNLVGLFPCAESDFEWTLAMILSRLEKVVVAGARLGVEAVGCVSFHFTTESFPIFHQYLKNQPTSYASIPLGSCCQSDRLVLVGVAEFHEADHQGSHLVAVTLSYFSSDGRKHATRVSLRAAHDLANHYHIEFTKRKKRLQVTDDEAQLVEQRRALMRKKMTFVNQFVAQEVADAENAFKKVNIMKEELWARRKWIIDRAACLLEEEELRTSGAVADAARSAFVQRTESLQSALAASSRGSESRGTSRGKNKSTANLHRIHLDQDTGSVQQGVVDSDEQESNDQRLHKVSVNLSIQTKALTEHERKIEDLFVSVRLAETKSLVIMNDAHRSWIVRFHDIMKVKSEVNELTLDKDFLEATLAFHEDRLVTRQEVEAEMQSTNALIARLEKELPKRRKRILLCAKEIVGSVVDEFEANERMEVAKFDLVRARLMRTMAVTEEMHVSCVYVCFPVEVTQLEVPTSKNVVDFTNLVHGICSSLRRMCDEISESPVCRRLSFGEVFLWWGLEQQPVNSADLSTLESLVESRRVVQDKAWATVVITYNALFSSALAMSELKATLSSARDQAKPVFHIQLESPHESLDAFRSHWTRRQVLQPAGTTTSLPSVEREFLAWKQNLTVFEGLLRSVEKVEAVSIPRTISRCNHSLPTQQTGHCWYYTCLECLWPAISSSRQIVLGSKMAESDSRRDQYGPWFLDLICHIGAWIDGIVSVSLQTAPRSYHIDPRAVSILSRSWEASLQDRIQHLVAKWNETVVRRTKEIQRQIGKLFKVYDEEAHDLEVLRFRLYKRSQEVLRGMQDRLSQLVDEKKLLETWLERLEDDEQDAGDGKENEQMASEELWQHLHQSEIATQNLEALDESNDIPSEEDITTAKLTLDGALRRSTRAILDLGRGVIEYRYRSLMRSFKKNELRNQIKLAQAKCDEQQAQTARMERIYDDAGQLLRIIHEQRGNFVVEDATAFFDSSCLEVYDPRAASIQVAAQDQLRKLANDLDFHASFGATITSEALRAQLRSSAAGEYRVRLHDAINTFRDVYSPTFQSIDTINESHSIATGRLKDFCQFCADEPGKTWESLLATELLIEKEVFEGREIQRTWGSWRIRFIDTLITLHTQRWWNHCRRLLQSTRDRLGRVESNLTRSFEQRCASESAYRIAVMDREKCGRRLVLLQRRLMETRQRQQTLLQLLRIARRCYDSGTVVKDRKLTNVKTDVMFKVWSRITDYHVDLIGTLFDSRNQCSKQLDVIEADIKSCQESLASCDTIIATKRQAWLQQSISDTIECSKADEQQQLAHRTLDLILLLEKQRVFKLLRVLDPRTMWLTQPVLDAWHEKYMSDYQHEVAIGKANGKPLVVGRSDVDDVLVQLSIARLDVIKQEKLRDSLRRKLRVFEEILDQQVELRHIIHGEAKLYHALGLQLTKRVGFLHDQYELSATSEYLQADEDNEQNPVSSIDRHSTLIAVRESRDEIADMISAAQHDFLCLEATTCQIAWRRQEHVACEHRSENAIEVMKTQLSRVESYLRVLKEKDDELFDLSLQSEACPDDTKDLDVSTTSTMGMDLNVARAIFDFHSRDQWFRSCLGETTALGERIKSLREVLVSLQAISKSRCLTTTSDDVSTEEGKEAPQSVDDSSGADEQISIIAQELRTAELMLLLNRFESRRAETTSEAMKDAINAYFESDTSDGLILSVSEINQRDVDAVLSLPALQSRMFNVGISTSERERLLALLRKLATSFDPRDVAGNLSELIFGASLDRNDLKLIFVLHSKRHVDEQWGVALVVLFFARLFRRAALKKAAVLRHSKALQLTTDKLQTLRDRIITAHAIRTLHQTPVTSSSVSNELQTVVKYLNIDRDANSSASDLESIAFGILMQRPLHRCLAWLMPDSATPICRIADELEQQQAVSERRPPKPTQLHVLMKDRHTVKIGWRPVRVDHDLVYVAEINECREDHLVGTDKAPKPFWTQFLTAEKTSHTFYNLFPGRSYWVRVRSGFSRTRLGAPCFPLLVTTLNEMASPSFQ